MRLCCPTGAVSGFRDLVEKVGGGGKRDAKTRLNVLIFHKLQMAVILAPPTLHYYGADVMQAKYLLETLGRWGERVGRGSQPLHF